MDCSLPGSSIHGIFQARVLEWVAISFYRGSSRPRDRTQVSRIAGRRFAVWATREAVYYLTNHMYRYRYGFSGDAVVKNPPANAGEARDLDCIPGRPLLEKENGDPFQCSCLENPVDRWAWRATWGSQSQTWPSMHRKTDRQMEAIPKRLNSVLASF